MSRLFRHKKKKGIRTLYEDYKSNYRKPDFALWKEKKSGGNQGTGQGKRLAENGGLEVVLEPDGVLGKVGPLRFKSED